jgi:hypothetical protein
LAAHTRAAEAALRAALDHHGVEAVPRVSVVRRGGSLVIEVSRSSLDTHTRSIAATRMIGAVRAIDPYARGIDVTFATA